MNTEQLNVRIDRIGKGIYLAESVATDSYDLAHRLERAGFWPSLKETRNGLRVTFRASKGFRVPAGNLLKIA